MIKRLLIIGLSLLMTFAFSSVAMAKTSEDPLVKITGGGSIYYEAWDMAETYGFNIHQISNKNENGNAKGTMQFTWHYQSGGSQENPQNQFIMKADITYINYNPATNEAWVGGTITKSNVESIDFNTIAGDPNLNPIPTENGVMTVFPVGSPFHIRIKDNGATDYLGMLFFCATDMEKHVGEKYVTWFQDASGAWTVPEELVELTNGNITIH